MNSRRSWLVFGAATFAYLVAVLQRSSLGVAGVDAAERFAVSAAALSSLAVVQLIVYAALQIPVGVFVDRVGPRRLIATGALLMLLGQLALAFAPGIAVALVGRILVGAGDALTFVSAIRLLVNWFSGRTLPILSQWLGTLGQFGQVLSAVPLSLLLHEAGWTPAFVAAAAASLLALVGVVTLVRDSPSSTMSTAELALARSHPLTALRDSFSRPGTRLGFWSHFVTQSPGTTIALIWGFPFFSVALGYGPATAALMLTLMVATAAVFGPLLGLLSARFPFRRSTIVLAIVAAMGVVWALVLAWPGQPPFALVVALTIVIAIGGPGSLIGFDFARTFNPLRSLGSANGIVNVGGFLATFVMIFLIGLILDAINAAAGGDGDSENLFTLDAFRIAFLVQYVVVGVGVVFLLRARRQTRRRLHEEEGIQVAPLWVAMMRMWRRRQ